MKGNSYQSLRDSFETRNQGWFFKAMFDCSHEGIFAFDRVGRCQMVNAAGGRLIGEAPEEWVDRSYKQLCKAEDGAKLEALFQGALLGISGDCTISLAHKKDIPCTVNLSVTSLEFEGEVQGVFFTARTLREMTEREIHYAAAQKVAHLGSWELDASNGSMYWSDETYRIFGLQRTDVELTYVTFMKYVHPEDEELVRTTVEKSLSQGAIALEYRILLPDGTVRTLIEEGETLFDATGRPVKLIGVVQDIAERRQEQERLREIEHRYQLIAENAQDIIFYCTPEGEIRFVSPAVRSLLGHDPEGMVGRLVSDYLHPDDIWQLSYREDTDKDVSTYRVRHQDGRYLWFETTLKFIRNEDGTPRKMLGVGRDITERLRADQDLRETKEELANILRQQLGVTFKYRKVGDDFLYTMADGQLLRLLGLSPEKVVGRRMMEMFPAENHAYLQSCYLRAWHGENVMYESRYNGYTYLVSLQPLYRDGQVFEVLASGMDITSLKQASNELRATKEQLEAFIEGNADAIAMFDYEGHLQRVNPAFEQLFGWTLEEMRGKQVLDLPIIPPKCQEQVIAMVREAQRGESKVGMETKRLTKSGVELDVLLSLSPTRDAAGHVLGWSVIMRDITEQKKAEQLLVQSEKLTIAGQLAAGIAHEIRNPLTSLKGFTQLMKVGAGRQEQYLAIMESELSRIEMILSELLVLAKPQAERFLLSDLGPIVEEVQALIESQAILHNIEIQCEVESDLPSVACDQNQLKQVFINFMKNAIEAMKGGGVIRVQVQRDGEEQVLVRFVDQGCGIPKERVARLGEPFYTTKEHGTGLGMMVSKRIIENHRGQMHVDSEVGVGTTIEVRFPCGEEEEEV